MWHLVKKEHIFTFLVILVAFVIFNYFNFNFNSLVYYDDQTCVNQGYQCCTKGINPNVQYDRTCTLDKSCYEYCSNNEAKLFEGIKTITGLGSLDFIKEGFSSDKITGKTVYDSSPGSITNDDIAITSLTQIENNQAELVFDVSNDVLNAGSSSCYISWGDGQSEYLNLQSYPNPYVKVHQFSSPGTKNVYVRCEVYDSAVGYPTSIIASQNIALQSSVITGIPQISITSLGGSPNTNNPSTNGYVYARLNVTDYTKFSNCALNWDQSKADIKWRTKPLLDNIIVAANDQDIYTASGLKTVYFRCIANDGTVREVFKTVQINLGGVSVGVGVIENYFRDGLFGLNIDCNAPGGICNGTTLDQVNDRASCTSASMCVFRGQCYQPGGLLDIKDALNNDYDSSLDNEICVSYYADSTRQSSVGSWIDQDVGDGNIGYGLGQYCEQKFVNNAWTQSGYKWISSGVKCQQAQRWGNLSLDYCDDTAAGLSNTGALGEGVTSNYCCGDDPNEYYITTNGKSACCATQSATVDSNGNCIGNVPQSFGNIDVNFISTNPQNKTLHYSNVDVFCKLSTAETSTTIRNCLSASINDIQCTFTRLRADNLAEFRDCALGGLLGNVTAQCLVKDSCISTTPSTRSRTTSLIITQPKICKQGDTEKDAIIKRLEIIDLNLNKDEFDVGSSLKLEIDINKDSSFRRSVDLSLEAVIYDLTTSKIVVEKKSSLIIGSREDEKSYTMNFTIPRKEFMDDDDVYRLYVKAYESGKEDSLCVEYLDGMPISIGNIDNADEEKINDTVQALDKDKDGYNTNLDCNDNNVLINPGASEICGDNIDNNCNGKSDENCIITPQPIQVADSDSDGIDDDWEIAFFGDLITSNSKTDFDKDGILDKEEFLLNKDPTVPDKQGNSLLATFAIIIVVIVLLVLGYLLIKKKPKKLNISNAKNTNELEDYIKRTLRKGYKKQQITNILLTKGWHKSEVENAFKKVEQEM